MHDAARADLVVREQPLDCNVQRLDERRVLEHVAKRRHTAVGGLKNRTPEAPGA